MARECSDFSISITSYIDDELEEDRQNELKDHLSKCSECNERYLQEMQVKKLVKEKLPILKAPAYLQNRIRRNLIRNGNRPGFLQLVQSLFLYRPVTTSFALALIAFLVFLPTIQLLDSPLSNQGSSFSERAQAAELKGEIICLDCEFMPQDGQNLVHEPNTHRHGLKTEDESIWTFVYTNSNKELLQDEKVLRRKAQVSGIIFRNSRYIYVQQYTLL